MVWPPSVGMEFVAQNTELWQAVNSGGMFGSGAGSQFYATHMEDAFDNLSPSFYVSSANPLEELYGLPTPEGSSPGQAANGLPPIDQIMELVDLFFEKVYPYTPIIHRPTLLSRLRTGGVDGIPRVLLLAIMTIAAKFHMDSHIRSQRNKWFEECKTKVSELMRTSSHVLQGLQAGMLITLEAANDADFGTALMLVADMWRKVVATGYHHIDGKGRAIMPALGSAEDETNWVQREEGRRLIWCLLIVDRGFCFPIGLVHVVDDKRLVVNFPMPEVVFQENTMEDAEPDIDDLPYCKDLDSLITAIQAYSRKGTSVVMHYILLAYILMGRVSEELYGPDFEYESNAPALDKLGDHLVRIRLILPRACGDLAVADMDDYGRIIWLHTILGADTILIHHRPAAKGKTPSESINHVSNWPHCREAARNTAAILRQAARSSTDFICNGQISTPLFFSFLVTILEYFDPGPRDATPAKLALLKADLELIVNTFIRQREVLPGIGNKYGAGAGFYLGRDIEHLKLGKTMGMRDFVGTCQQWKIGIDPSELTVPDRTGS